MGEIVYILKHKNIDVAILNIEGGDVINAVEIKNKEHLPYKYEENMQKNVMLLNKWIENRGIALSREDHDEIMTRYGVRSSKELTVLSMGLSLSDHYWLCEEKKEKTWAEVNFYENEFSTRIGEIIAGRADKDKNIFNPDFSSSGSLRKFWTIDEGKRYLCKAGSGDLKQEPYNEHIASVIESGLGIEHVEYNLEEFNGEIYSKCECMTDKDNEFLNAFMVFLEGDKNKGRYENYIDICSRKGIKNAEEEINRMIVLDYMIRNTDRNLNNYGILRNSETLEWVKINPIYDNGNSFWHDTQVIENIKGKAKSNCKSFLGENEKNLELVKNYEWLDFTKIEGIDKTIEKILKSNKAMEGLRAEKITIGFNERIMELKKHALLKSTYL